MDHLMTYILIVQPPNNLTLATVYFLCVCGGFFFFKSFEWISGRLHTIFSTNRLCLHVHGGHCIMK